MGFHMVSPILAVYHLRFFIAVISHLLVTKPSKSRALECFVVDIARRSTHIAMLVRSLFLTGATFALIYAAN